jgi:hypothetical protein
MAINKEYTGKDIETLPFPSNVRVDQKCILVLQTQMVC